MDSISAQQGIKQWK